ncbi:MAG: hypothetical protein QOE79_2440 [Sphingomonadales bacterium]|nr:hypothetical protein [Sphingomonadales bacterium]MEA3049458.1 hypothetical protein [Sphingomonadales bacterium]
MARGARPVTLTALSVGLAVGLLVEIPALLFAIASAGAGHGDYVAARALFPIPMLLTVFQHGRIGAVSIAIALLQFPLYGGLGAWIARRRKNLLAALAALAHVLAAIACFSGWIPGFS